MKVKKGDILVGTNPYTHETKKYKYVGISDKAYHASGFKHVLIEGGTRQKIIVTNSWAKAWQLKKFKG